MSDMTTATNSTADNRAADPATAGEGAQEEASIEAHSPAGDPSAATADPADGGEPAQAPTGESGTQILPLNEAEQTWVRDLLAYAKQLGITESPRALEEFFEEQRTAWYAVDEESRADPNPLINLMGAVIGQILVERCEMKWCVLIDEQGASLAVASEVGSIAMFPMNAVAKRWTGQNMTSLTEFLRLSQAEIHRVREEHAEEE